MPLMNTPTPVNFHISLNVANLDRSVAFFRKLFAQEPAKSRDDYAKFEVTNPPLTLSLEPMSPAGRGALNHLGFRFSNSAELVELQRRLEMAGLSSQREEGVECCYAKQTKFWLHDPDNNLWEFYVLDGDIEHRGAGQTEQEILGDQSRQKFGKPTFPITCSTSPARQTIAEVVETKLWAHRLGETAQIPEHVAPGSLGEVALQGTFNGELDDAATESLLDDVLHALAEGGRVSVHCLTADRAVTDKLSLPGPAAVVKNVPVDVDLLGKLEERGFTGIRLTKFGASPCFHVNGAQMRETMIEAYKPAACTSEQVVVVYQGPFREVTVDSGEVLRRGERTPLPQSVWNSIQQGAAGHHFTKIEAPRNVVACGS